MRLYRQDDLKMKKFVILTHYGKDKELRYTNLIREWLAAHGGESWLPPYYPGEGLTKSEHYDLTDVPEDVDCAIVLGGDGTLLLGARQMFPLDVPVFGINLGTLGFLTSAEVSSLPDCLIPLISDTYNVEERMMLKGTVRRGNEEIMKNIALNDIVTTRSGFLQLVDVKLSINNELIGVYGGDGIIVSTPTGATGYNLSAGGPIVFPQADVMIITPICPHTLQNRSIVVSGGETITIEIGKRHKTLKDGTMVTFDGNAAGTLITGDRIEIKAYRKKAKLIKTGATGFYQVLKEKIGNVQGVDK